MCLALLAIDVLPDTPLLVLGNRDEFHARPSASAAPWREDARIVGGRDLQAGGTWLAARSDGRWALVTNHRVRPPVQAPCSRGFLVSDFVRGTEAPDVAARRVLRSAHAYTPFHLLLGQGSEVWRVDNDGAQPSGVAATPLTAGVHTLSNGSADATWPKQRRLESGFRTSLAAGLGTDDIALLQLLADRSQPTDAELPDTGIGPVRERLLAPIFIAGQDYGTRCCNLLRLRADGALHLLEQRFGAGGVTQGAGDWHCAAEAEASSRAWIAA
jgi:uncharacterized protein with NRDE domain